MHPVPVSCESVEKWYNARGDNENGDSDAICFHAAKAPFETRKDEDRDEYSKNIKSSAHSAELKARKT